VSWKQEVKLPSAPSQQFSCPPGPGPSGASDKRSTGPLLLLILLLLLLLLWGY